MRASLLAELANLFSREASAKRKRKEIREAERLEEIEFELHERFAQADRIEMLRGHR